MKLKTIYIPLIFAFILFAGIFLFDAVGMWQIESSKEPATIKDGEFAGMADPQDIRGSYSFDDIAANFDVTPEVLAQAFGVSSDRPGDFLCKDLEGYYGLKEGELEVGTGSVKEFVALYTKLPYVGDDGFPDTAVAVLKEAGIWNNELEADFTGRIVKVSGLVGELVEEDPDEDSDEHAEEDSEVVKGKTTVADVISWGLTNEEIEAVLGIEISNKNLAIRELCTQNDLSFSEIKGELNNLLGEK